ncbi:hypothetical protein [Amycolatopsis saalfeldensis]|uniref:Peptidase inhibitor family I36 n=1 Tax=Amycolatopsis saalfeldensis TaxID=394193 RepID=A0A1H8YCB6_9PSEU|nr:hypothetical protein [Amycolatopsis saalfeldensis]SEP49727.1 hypothetical protein SAMN04489732_113182 [Amycolatopsis saalfeldensis]
MKLFKTLTVAVAATALAIVAPVAAQAAPAAPATPASPAAPAPDGLLHVYYGFTYLNQCNAWSGDVPDWGACRNRAASLWNNGYSEDVYVYYSLNYANARRGICKGVGLGNLMEWPFEQGEGPGSGQQLFANIASSRWQYIAGCH